MGRTTMGKVLRKFLRKNQDSDLIYSLVVTVSNKHLKSQIVHKPKSLVLMDISTTQKRIYEKLPEREDAFKTGTVDAAQLVGKVMAEQAVRLGIKEITWCAPLSYRTVNKQKFYLKEAFNERIQAFIDTFREKSDIQLNILENEG